MNSNHLAFRINQHFCRGKPGALTRPPHFTRDGINFTRHGIKQVATYHSDLPLLGVDLDFSGKAPCRFLLGELLNVY
jgi:hypothetical protein